MMRNEAFSHANDAVWGTPSACWLNSVFCAGVQVIATPLLTKALAGALIPVSMLGLLTSTLQARHLLGGTDSAADATPAVATNRGCSHLSLKARCKAVYISTLLRLASLQDGRAPRPQKKASLLPS